MTDPRLSPSRVAELRELAVELREQAVDGDTPEYAYDAELMVDASAALSCLLDEVEALRADKTRPSMPTAEIPLSEWSQAETCLGGRSDDALIYLTTVNGRSLGYLTLGWFREHTDLAEVEQITLSNRASPLPRETT